VRASSPRRAFGFAAPRTLIIASRGDGPLAASRMIASEVPSRLLRIVWGIGRSSTDERLGAISPTVRGGACGFLLFGIIRQFRDNSSGWPSLRLGFEFRGRTPIARMKRL